MAVSQSAANEAHTITIPGLSDSAKGFLLGVILSVAVAYVYYTNYRLQGLAPKCVTIAVGGQVSRACDQQ